MDKDSESLHEEEQPDNPQTDEENQETPVEEEEDEEPVEPWPRRAGRAASLPGTRWAPLPDNAPTLQDFTVLGVDDQSVQPENLTMEDLEKCCVVMEQSNATVRAENELLESYLTDVDPILIENMEKILEAATAAILKAERTVQLGMMASVTSQTPRESSTSSPRSTGQSQGASGSKVAAFTLSDKGPKVQPQQKVEIIQRSIDIFKATHDENQAKAEKEMFILECKREGLAIDLTDLEALRKQFDDALAKDWVDPMTRTVPGEKIIAFFELRNRQDAVLVNEYRPRIKNLKIRQDAANNKLKEMGEELHFVDYEQLIIETKGSQKNLADALIASSELRKANTKYLSLLNSTRTKIKELASEVSKTSKETQSQEVATNKMLTDEARIRKEVEKWQAKIDGVVSRNQRFSVPDGMDYVRHKAEVSDVTNALKTIQRKNKSYEFDTLNKIKAQERQNAIEMKTDQKNGVRPRLYTRSTYWHPPHHSS